MAHQEIDIFDPVSMEGTGCFTETERDSFSQMLSLGFTDSFRKLNPDLQKFSFWNNLGGMRQANKGWRIDYMLVSSMEAVVDSTIHAEYWGSDHCPTLLKVDTDKTGKEESTKGVTPENI